jgi:hypothetical protein
MVPPKYTWYVEPLDKATNEAISRQLNLSCDTDQTSDRVQFGAIVIDSLGKKHKADLIQISTDQKNILLDAAKTKPLQFTLYVKRGGGQIRFCPRKYVEGTPVFEKVFEDVSFSED